MHVFMYGTLDIKATDRVCMHTSFRKRFPENALAVGANPFGPHGGNCGSVSDGSLITPWVSKKSLWLTALLAMIQQKIASGGGTIDLGQYEWFARSIVRRQAFKPDPESKSAPPEFPSLLTDLLHTPFCVAYDVKTTFVHVSFLHPSKNIGCFIRVPQTVLGGEKKHDYFVTTNLVDVDRSEQEEAQAWLDEVSESCFHIISRPIKLTLALQQRVELWS